MRLLAMALLGAAGLAAFAFGSFLVRRPLWRDRDWGATGRVLQIVGLALLVLSLLIRPPHPATRAFPPPEDSATAGP